ncbi:MAG: thermopsin family protease [Nitrososphaerota archaeon]|nr:thermopsin family protease [Nitrososphaerota archaeon]
MGNENRGRYSRRRKWSAVFLLLLLLVASPLALHSTESVFASSTGFNISAQSTLALGQTIKLTGTVCPNPSNTFTFVVVVNYTGPSGQVVSKTEQIGYGQVSLCNSPFTIDSSTLFNSTGDWQIQAQAQWTDSNDVPQTMNSNSFDFTVVAQQTTTTSSSSTSTSSSVITTISSIASSTSATSTTTSSTSSCGFVSGICSNNFVSTTSSASKNVTLSANSEASIQLNVTQPSYLGYFAISSSASIEEGILSPTQFDAFTQYGQAASLCDGSAASYSESCGTSLLNGLLILPGSYYLVVYSPQSSTQVYFGYDSSLSLQVVNATTYVGAFVDVSAGAPASFTVSEVTIGSPSVMQLFGISNVSVNYQITDLITQKVVFTSPYLTTTNVTGTMPASSVEPYYSVALPPSIYQLSIAANPADQADTNAEVYFEYNLTMPTINPYYFILADKVLASQFGVCITTQCPYTSAPMGVASFGLYNDSGAVSPYPQAVETPALLGATEISAIRTNVTCSYSPCNDASNQLNGELVVINNDGSRYVYWTQNAVVFNTDGKQAALWDDVNNQSGDYATLTNTSITSPYGDFASGGYFGIQNNPQYLQNRWMSYTLPLQYAFGMSETVIPGVGVEINMSNDVINGFQQTGLVTFDQITIHDPDIKTAYYYVSGTEYTPSGLVEGKSFFDAENIFGGGGGGAAADFVAFGARVNVGYIDPGTQNFAIFPSGYSFGQDTGESAVNLKATYAGNGTVALSIGQSNWQYIYPGSSSTTSGHSSTAITSSVKTGPQGLNYGLLAIVAVAIVVTGGGATFVVRRRRALPPPP